MRSNNSIVFFFKFWLLSLHGKFQKYESNQGGQNNYY
jgi:hypothetical protein